MAEEEKRVWAVEIRFTATSTRWFQYSKEELLNWKADTLLSRHSWYLDYFNVTRSTTALETHDHAAQVLEDERVTKQLEFIFQ